MSSSLHLFLLRSQFALRCSHFTCCNSSLTFCTSLFAFSKSNVTSCRSHLTSCRSHFALCLLNVCSPVFCFPFPVMSKTIVYYRKHFRRNPLYFCSHYSSASPLLPIASDMCRSPKLKGGGVPSPEGLQLNE